MRCYRIFITLVTTTVLFSCCLPCSYASADGSVPVITKNPTSEAIAIGGKTWFIAHADNANTMTWELVDANGNIYSLVDAMAMHPGLKLEALEGDTIAVSNVPVSVNGWGVQATFYGQGGAVSTSPAYIYVGDFLTYYGSVIEKNRFAKQNGVSGYGQAYENNVSEWISYYEHVGYALKDLDKNGIPELLVAGIDSQSSNPVLFEAYTLINNTPIQLLISWTRNCYYLTYDNRIYNRGSGGASHTSMEFYKLSGAVLKFEEGFLTDDNADYTGIIIYHTTKAKPSTGRGQEYRDYSNPDATFPGGYYATLSDQIDAQCWLPQLSLIA